MSAIQIVQIISISTALLASGGIASYSIFAIPFLKSQPASRSLPSTRWLFSRGSHVFPTAAFLSSSGFAYLAYSALPSGKHTLPTLAHHATTGKAGLYLAAAALTIAIAPWTAFVMIPTNFELIRRNEEKGGSRSAKSAQYREEKGLKGRSAEQSTDGKEDVSQWTDLSGPQERTAQDSTVKDDREVRQLLDRFNRLNFVRAVLIGFGGVVGLFGALC